MVFYAWFWKLCVKKEKSAKYGKLVILNVDGVIWIVDGMLCVGMWLWWWFGVNGGNGDV